LSNKMKLKRITDLFNEGETCFLGDDEDAKPICVWVNKNNSLEEDEARLDAQSARTEILLAMSDPMHPEVVVASMELEEYTNEELFQVATNQKYEESLTLALQDIEADEEWKEKLEYLRRQPELLDEAKVADDDPRRLQITKYNTEYLAHVEELGKKRQDKILADFTEAGRQSVIDSFLKDYKDKISIEHYVLESRVTKLFYAIRECEAIRKENGDGWDHKSCDHSKRLLESRTEVRELPDHVLNLILDTFESLSVGARNVANFPVPQNSSESSV
jgi:hypothetical protein